MNPAPNLQTAGGEGFGDGLFQPGDHVTIHAVSNLAEGLRAVVKAYETEAKLYVIKDATGSIWGLKSEKLRPMQTLSIEDIGTEWVEVAEGVVIPHGLEIAMDLATGRKRVRRIATA
jgi:hypothetical protein